MSGENNDDEGRGIRATAPDSDDEADSGGSAELFERYYGRPDWSFTQEPSPELHDLAALGGSRGRALDLGCGDGRNSIYLASLGYSVTSVDQSANGLRKLEQTAERAGLKKRIDLIRADVRSFEYPQSTYDVIAAITVLDHLPAGDETGLMADLARSLVRGGRLYVSVHTTGDPGATGDSAHASELASAIRHYFAPEELRLLSGPSLSVVHYEVKREHDTSHGRPHEHEFARMVAARV